MRTIILTRATGLLALAGGAAAQAYEYPAYDAYGFGTYGDATMGDRYEIDGYDEEAVGFPYGDIVLTTEGTTEQSIDVVVTGPDGYTRTFESESGAQTEIVELPVGTHSISATDDGLQMGHVLVDVRTGMAQDVTLSLANFEQTGGEVGEDYALESGYYGVEEELGDGYEPYGSYQVEGYEDYDNAEAGAIAVTVEGFDENGEVVAYDELGVDVNGHVVGPNDERSELSGESTTFEDLPAGTYSISATAAEHRVAQTFVQVQPGQRVTLRVQMTALQQTAQDTASGEGVAAGLYQDWDANGDDALGAEEYEAGLYDTLAGEDGELSEGEFDDGISRLRGDDADVSFADVDGDGNGTVTEEEFTSAYEPTRYSEWDADGDGAVTSDEFERGWFDTVDANGDGTVTEDEYTPFAGWFGNDYGEIGAGEDGISEEGWLGT